MFSGNIRSFQTFRMISVKNHIVSLPDEYVNETAALSRVIQIRVYVGSFGSMT